MAQMRHNWLAFEKGNSEACGSILLFSLTSKPENAD